MPIEIAWGAPRHSWFTRPRRVGPTVGAGRLLLVGAYATASYLPVLTALIAL